MRLESRLRKGGGKSSINIHVRNKVYDPKRVWNYKEARREEPRGDDDWTKSGSSKEWTRKRCR